MHILDVGLLQPTTRRYNPEGSHLRRPKSLERLNGYTPLRLLNTPGPRWALKVNTDFCHRELVT
jgi:hypothetical protein